MEKSSSLTVEGGAGSVNEADLLLPSQAGEEALHFLHLHGHLD